MAKTLAGVLAVAVGVLIFAGCGGANNAPDESSTSTTAAKTVVSTFCGAIKTNAPGDYEAASDQLTQALVTGVPSATNLGHIFFVWSDASITETAEICNR
jgi:hypothetical protein